MDKVIQLIPKREAVSRKIKLATASLIDEIDALVTQSLLDEANAHDLIRPQKIISSPKLTIISIKSEQPINDQFVIGMVDQHLILLIKLGFVTKKRKPKVQLKIIKI